MNTQTRYLSVPGARLCYDIQGSGPLLAMIGSPMGSRGFAEIAGLLARTYTVLTYDPRGILRSTVDDPAQDAAPELLADDVSRLITATEAGPAFLFGNSGGGVTGLALLARHPEQVRVLVAHEPPLIELLPDRDGLRAAISEAVGTYTGTGRDAGLRQYTALTGIQFGRRSTAPDTETFTPPDDVRAILDRFFLNILEPTTRYRPDVATLRETSSRIVAGAGIGSQGQLYHRSAVALARHLDLPVVEFPGGHTGFQEEPEQFADLLNRAFSEALETSPQSPLPDQVIERGGTWVWNRRICLVKKGRMRDTILAHTVRRPACTTARTSRRIMIGSVPLGGGAPVTVQARTTTVCADVAATSRQIAELSAAGCQIVHVAVRSQDDADALPQIVRGTPVPVIADMHFKSAHFDAVAAGCAAIRIDPGDVKGMIAAAAAGIPVQIGVNADTLDPRIVTASDQGVPRALVESALHGCALFANQGITEINVALEHHDPVTLVEACRILAARCDYPLHLGLSVAGPLQETVKSAVAFGVLLAEGIGASIQVSLRAPPVEEVRVGVQILQSLGLHKPPQKLLAGPSPAPEPDGEGSETGQILTPRQIDVVRFAVLGLTAKETARRLGISKNTVDEHLREARLRVGAYTKSQLIGWAVGSGAITYVPEDAD